MADLIVQQKTCIVCETPKPLKDFFRYTNTARYPDRKTTCRLCLQIARFWSYVEKTETCWVWIGSRNKDGYGSFDHIRAHLFSWQLHDTQKLQRGYCVLHRCDNPPCVRPDHLYAGTKKNNYEDMINRSRAGKEFISRMRDSILTPKIVKEARRVHAAGQMSITDLANQHGVAYCTMQQAIQGKHAWAHLD